MHLLLNLSPETALLSRQDPGQHKYSVSEALIEQIENNDLVETAQLFIGGAEQKAANSLTIKSGKLTGSAVIEALQTKQRERQREKTENRAKLIEAVDNAQTLKDCMTILPASNCTTWLSGLAKEFPDVDLTRVRELKMKFERQRLIDYCEMIESGCEPSGYPSDFEAACFADLRPRLMAAADKLKEILEEKRLRREEADRREYEERSTRRKQAEIEAEAVQRAREAIMHKLIEFLCPDAVEQFEAGLLADGEIMRFIEEKLRSVPGATLGKRLRVTDQYGDKFKITDDRKMTVAEFAALKSQQTLMNNFLKENSIKAVVRITPVSFTLHQKFEKAWEVFFLASGISKGFSLYFEPISA